MDERQQEDLEMMRDSRKWPAWPFLPIKKYAGKKHGPVECAVLYTDGGFTVILANLFGLAKQIETAKRIEFSSFEEIIEDGWEVD